MIFPRPKKVIYKEAKFCGDFIFKNDEIGRCASELLLLFSPAAKCSLSDTENVVLRQANLKNDGEYRLNITENEIVIEYKDYEGMRNAISSLSCLAQKGDIPCVQVEDYPDNKFRSCLLDLARGYVEIDLLKEHLVRLAKLKFTVAHLHLMDRQTYILESDVVPNPEGYRKYTKDELKDIVAFCKKIGLEAIPEIEFPAHAVDLLNSIPELCCDIIDLDKAKQDVEAVENPKKEFYIDKRRVSSWAVCLGKESTYEIYDKIIDEIVDIFDSEYLHIGADEITFDVLAAFPHWNNCHNCKALSEQYGGDLISIYHHALRRINEIVKSKGKKMIKWNESRENSHAMDLPTDIIIEFWMNSCFANSQNDINRLIDMGYTLINAQYQYTYVDDSEYMTTEKINGWTPSKTPEQKAAIWGGEMCAWEMGNPEYAFYNHTLAVCMGYFCDRVWNSDVVEYDDKYQKLLFETAIGCGELQINPLGIFADKMPPRNINVFEGLSAENVRVTDIPSLVEHLESISKDKCYGKFARAGYIKYLKNLYSQMTKA